MSQSTDGKNYYYDKSVYSRDLQLQTLEEEKLYLSSPTVPYTADYYKRILGMTEEELDKLTIEECNKYEYIIASYSLFIKRAANIQKSRIIYLKHKLNQAIINNVRSYSGYSWENQKYLSIKDDAAAIKYNEDLVVAEQQYARLEDLHFGISNIADKFKNIRFSKQQELRNE